MKLNRSLINTSNSLIDLLEQLEAANADETEKAMYCVEFIRIHTWRHGIPYYGKFELTPFCNLDCRMCYVHLRPEQAENCRVLTTAQWKAIMKEASERGMSVATLTGGECLTHPNFEELYLYLHSLGIQNIVMTNGVLLNENKIHFFLEHPPKLIQISLYGSNEEGYEKVTGHSVFARVIKNIKRIQEAHLPLLIAVTPSIFMEQDVENIIRLLTDMNVPYQINASLFDPYEQTGRKGQAVDMPRERYLQIYKLQAVYKGRSLIPSCEDELPMPQKEIDGGIGLLCGGGNNSFVVNHQGMMYPCSMLQEFWQDLLDQSFSEAWNAIHSFVKAYPRPKECESCKYKGVCTNCVVEHQKGAPKGHASPEVCAWGKVLLREGFASLEGR